MRRTARAVSLVLASWLSLVLPAAPALGAVSCTFEPVKAQVVITASADWDQVVLLRGADDEILVNSATCTGGGQTATVSNTSVVRVNDSAGDQGVTVDLTGGLFAGVSFVFSFGDGTTDGFAVVGTSWYDVMLVGATTFSIPGSTGTHSGTDKVVLHGGGGPDTLWLAGSKTDPAFAGEGHLLGQDGHDTLHGGTGPDAFIGGAGRDLVSYAGRMDDLTLSADGAADDGAIAEGDRILADVESLEGGEGDDVIEPPTSSAGSPGEVGHCDPAAAGGSAPEVCGGGGSDTFPLPVGIVVAGGEGTDTVDFSSSTGAARVDEGGNLSDYYGGGTTATVRADVEVVVGSIYPDYLIGGDDPNVLIGGAGADTLDGGLGPDEIAGGAGTDTVGYGSHSTGVRISLNGLEDDGLAGEDFLHDDIEKVFGGDGGDTIVGSDVGNVLNGGFGPDTIDGGGGADTLRGGSGLFTDILEGGLGNDTLKGEFGNDVLSGGPGPDALLGQQNDDELTGGPGNDVLDGGPGADAISGGGGDQDRVDYDDRTARVVVTLGSGDDDGEAGEGDFVSDDVEEVEGGSGNDEFVSASRGLGGTVVDNTFIGNGGADTLKGGDGEDVIYGWEENDEILGGGGADWLYGGRNVDTIKGEGGADRIFGGQHTDTLKGNSGNDVFFAEDGFLDDVIGGTGTDTAHVDAFDDVSGCEIVD